MTHAWTVTLICIISRTYQNLFLISNQLIVEQKSWVESFFEFLFCETEKICFCGVLNNESRMTDNAGFGWTTELMSLAYF